METIGVLKSKKHGIKEKSWWILIKKLNSIKSVHVCAYSILKNKTLMRTSHLCDA